MINRKIKIKSTSTMPWNVARYEREAISQATQLEMAAKATNKDSWALNAPVSYLVSNPITRKRIKKARVIKPESH